MPYSSASSDMPPHGQQAGFMSPSCAITSPSALARCVKEHKHSQHYEDQLLFPTLLLPFPDESHEPQRRRIGSYVEIGAFDGVNHSNTFALERCCHWTGTLIEANPVNFAALNQSGRTGRRVHSGICTTPGTMQISSQGGVFAQARETGAVKGTGSLHLRKDVKDGGFVQVPCDTLTNILDATHGTGARIDFLSLDVQGAEELVMQTVDLRRFKVILVEVAGHAAASLARIYARMSAADMVDVTWNRHCEKWGNRSWIRGTKGSLVFMPAAPRWGARCPDWNHSQNHPIPSSQQFIEPVQAQATFWPGFNLTQRDLASALTQALTIAGRQPAPWWRRLGDR